MPPYFDSQAQAAATLKIDISELREAKAEGCPAFRSDRVYIAPLLAWFAETRQRHAKLAAAKATDKALGPTLLHDSEKNGELPKSHWDRKKAQLDYERARYRFEVEKEKYLELSEITLAVGQMLVGFRTALNISSWCGGIGPGIVVVLASTAGINYFLEQPLYRFGLGLHDIPRLVEFVLIATVVNFLAAARRRVEGELRQSRDLLKAQVEQRRALNVELEKRSEELQATNEELEAFA